MIVSVCMILSLLIIVFVCLFVCDAFSFYTVALSCKELSQSQAYLDIALVLSDNIRNAYIVTGGTAALAYVLRGCKSFTLSSPLLSSSSLKVIVLCCLIIIDVALWRVLCFLYICSSFSFPSLPPLSLLQLGLHRTISCRQTSTLSW